MNLSFGSFNLSLTGTAILLILGIVLLIMAPFRSKKEVRHFDADKTIEVSTAKELARIGKKAQRKQQKLVATINVTGPILTNSNGASPLQLGKVTYGETIVDLIDHLRLSPFVEAVIVYLSTPGGSVPASQMIHDAINRCRAVKPVYAYIKDISASGGVMAMVGATEVIAAPGSLTGSIGVIGPTLMRFEGVTEYKGIFGSGVVAKSITGKTVFAGVGKNLGDPFASDEEFAAALVSFEALIKKSHREFVAHVATARDIDQNKLISLGAQIFGAGEAREIGLIDNIMTLDDFKMWVAEELGDDTGNADVCFVSVTTPQPRKSGFQRIISGSVAQTDSADTVHLALRDALQGEMQLAITTSYLHQ